MTKPTGKVNPTYKLDALDRFICGMMYSMNLWTSTSIAKTFGIDRSLVARHGKAYKESRD